MVVIDPPYVTREVWAKYAEAAHLLLKPDASSRVLGSTLEENAGFMNELLGCNKKTFKPFVPNLVYKYCLYTNYESERLNQPNPEVLPEYDFYAHFPELVPPDDNDGY